MYMLYCSLLHSVPLLKGYSYYTPTPRRGGGYTVLPLSVSPRYFSSHFSQQLSMAEIWYLVTSFIYVCHIVGSVFGPVRFLLPVCRLCWFLYTLNICSYFVAFFSANIDGRNLIFRHKPRIGTPFCGNVFFWPVRFLLPVCRLSWLLYTFNIYAHFSSHFSQQLLMAEIWYLVTSFI